MPIVPDDKNWTWVLEQRCPECGFDGRRIDVAEVASMIRDNAAAWAPLLADPQVHTRPDDDHWSALEYGCHVRDVYRLYRYRLGLMLDQDGARFPNWDQDATAVDDRYGEQDPVTVTHELDAAAAALAEAFEQVDGDEWMRTGFRSDGAAFTIDSFARYLVHDPVHHVHDVRTGYARLG
jgi:hypothetical protein